MASSQEDVLGIRKTHDTKRPATGPSRFGTGGAYIGERDSDCRTHALRHHALLRFHCLRDRGLDVVLGHAGPLSHGPGNSRAHLSLCQAGSLLGQRLGAGLSHVRLGNTGLRGHSVLYSLCNVCRRHRLLLRHRLHGLVDDRRNVYCGRGLRNGGGILLLSSARQYKSQKAGHPEYDA